MLTEDDFVQKPLWYRAIVLFMVITPVVGVFAAMVLLWNTYVFQKDVVLFFSLWVLTCLGITIGYHRMLTHKSFDAPAPIRAFFMILGCMAVEGSPVWWAATHIYHHAHSDEEGDPHSPLNGFWHAHMGWIFADKHVNPKKYAPHLLQDPTVMFVERTHVLWVTLSFLLPFLLGGWTGFVWGGLVRMFFSHHVTWSVNSVCHTFGKRDYETTDESRNNWLVGLLAMGEGWHNNHHAFPQSAFHGLHWWQFDLSGLIIRGMAKVGIASNVQTVSPALMAAKKQKVESKRLALAELKKQLNELFLNAKEDLSTYAARLREEYRTRAQQKKLHSPKTEKMFSRVNAAYEDAIKRLESMQRAVQKQKSLRKEKKEALKQEIRDFVVHTKGRMKQEMRRIGAIV